MSPSSHWSRNGRDRSPSPHRRRDSRDRGGHRRAHEKGKGKPRSPRGHHWYNTDRPAASRYNEPPRGKGPYDFYNQDRTPWWEERKGKTGAEDAGGRGGGFAHTYHSKDHVAKGEAVTGKGKGKATMNAFFAQQHHYAYPSNQPAPNTGHYGTKSGKNVDKGKSGWHAVTKGKSVDPPPPPANNTLTVFRGKPGSNQHHDPGAIPIRMGKSTTSVDIDMLALAQAQSRMQEQQQVQVAGAAPQAGNGNSQRQDQETESRSELRQRVAARERQLKAEALDRKEREELEAVQAKEREAQELHRLERERIDKEEERARKDIAEEKKKCRIDALIRGNKKDDLVELCRKLEIKTAKSKSTMNKPELAKLIAEAEVVREAEAEAEAAEKEEQIQSGPEGTSAGAGPSSASAKDETGSTCPWFLQKMGEPDKKWGQEYVCRLCEHFGKPHRELFGLTDVKWHLSRQKHGKAKNWHDELHASEIEKLKSERSGPPAWGGRVDLEYRGEA
ncbi:unnamed protein product [Amoebophrya sp. A120]|nr:unnamed protein product [Amoebophrya sp. A120]|eukprot:GSA120T00020015001.1